MYIGLTGPTRADEICRARVELPAGTFLPRLADRLTDTAARWV